MSKIILSVSDLSDDCDSCSYYKGTCTWKTPKGTKHYCVKMVLTEDGRVMPEELVNYNG